MTSAQASDDVGSIVEPTSSLAWADVIRADFQRVLSHYIQNISTCISCRAKRGLRTVFIQKSKPKYAQNHRGLNRPILRPLWFMTSAAADVISVPSVRDLGTSFWANTVVMFIKIKFRVNTDTKNIYFLNKRNVYTPTETWTDVWLRLPGNTIPWNLSVFAFIESSANHLTIA